MSQPQETSPATTPPVAEQPQVQPPATVEAQPTASTQQSYTSPGGTEEEASKEDQANKEEIERVTRSFQDGELWEQVRRHTRNIEIDEESDYYWPESRSAMEPVIEELLKKRVMFVRSVSEDWLTLAVKRLASVLHANGRPPQAVIRMTRTSQGIKNEGADQLNFGFWASQRRLPYPVILFITSDRYDFLQKLLDQRKATACDEMISVLKELNIFIVCEVEDNLPNRELFENAKKWVKEVYAFWNVPVISLELMKQFGHEGRALASRIEAAGLVKDFGERRVFEEIMERDYSSSELLPSLPGDLNETKSEIKKNKDVLVDFMEGDDFIKQTVIFCGVFFHGLYYPDFYRLVHELLLDEEECLPAEKNMVVDKEGHPVPRQLRKLWERNADRYLKECKLKVVRESGNQRVEFVNARLTDIMSAYILDRQYPFFHRVYRHFEQAGLLTNLSMSEKMETYIIRFFALAARLDTTNHNSRWLKKEVHKLWRAYGHNLPTQKNYEQVMSFLKKEKELPRILFLRIPRIIGGLLTNSNEEFREVIRDFFGLLLNERDAKIIAIIIASHLYREYRLTDIFSKDDLMSYFRETLEKGDWEDSFFSYDALRDNMKHDELFVETSAWITNGELAEDSWVKHFAYYYQLDYLLVTFLRYFRQFKSEAEYELWEGSPEDGFPPQFCQLVKRLLSKSSLTSLEKILEPAFNTRRFVRLARFFASIESDYIMLKNGYILLPNDSSISLVADVIETWFYLLVHKREELKPDDRIEERWMNYARLVIESADPKVRTSLWKCWITKTGFYNMQMQERLAESPGMDDVNRSHRKHLHKRRTSLRLLMRTIQEAQQTTAIN
jgi:hypothetical protein